MFPARCDRPSIAALPWCAVSNNLSYESEPGSSDTFANAELKSWNERSWHGTPLACGHLELTLELASQTNLDSALHSSPLASRASYGELR